VRGWTCDRKGDGRRCRNDNTSLQAAGFATASNGASGGGTIALSKDGWRVGGVGGDGDGGMGDDRGDPSGGRGEGDES
jgi:hypothetical protein